MTPDEREKFDLEIYLETKNFHGCISDAADYLRLRDPSRISRLLNPTDTRANNICGELVDVLEGFNHRHPKLAQAIWSKIVLKVNGFMDFNEGDADLLKELGEIADTAAREQLDVNFAISSRKTPEEIELEAFQAYEKSRVQYEKARALRNRLPKQSAEESK
jgi:hypothetical protein